MTNSDDNTRFGDGGRGDKREPALSGASVTKRPADATDDSRSRPECRAAVPPRPSQSVSRSRSVFPRGCPCPCLRRSAVF